MAFVVFHSPDNTVVHPLNWDLTPCILADKVASQVLCPNRLVSDLRFQLNNKTE